MSNKSIIKPKKVLCATERCFKLKDLDGDGLCPRCVSSKANIAKSDAVSQWPCTVCKLNCEEDSRSLICEVCQYWTHSSCMKMTEKEYELIQRFPSVSWYCSDKCWGKVRDAIENAHHLETKFNVLHREFSEIKTKFLHMEEKVQEKVFRETGEAVNENSDIERRKMNLILFNLPENAVHTGKSVWDDDKTRQHDLSAIIQMAKDELGLEVGTKIDRVIRLGFRDKEKADSKPRPVKVIFKDIKMKRDVLTNAKLLRQSRNHTHRRIFISPDLTEAQRIKDHQLRSQMWNARENENRNVIIQKGRLVEVDYPVRKQRVNTPLGSDGKKRKPSHTTKKKEHKCGPYKPQKTPSTKEKTSDREETKQHIESKGITPMNAIVSTQKTSAFINQKRWTTSSMDHLQGIPEETPSEEIAPDKSVSRRIPQATSQEESNPITKSTATKDMTEEIITSKEQDLPDTITKGILNSAESVVQQAPVKVNGTKCASSIKSVPEDNTLALVIDSKKNGSIEKVLFEDDEVPEAEESPSGNDENPLLIKEEPSEKEPILKEDESIIKVTNDHPTEKSGKKTEMALSTTNNVVESVIPTPTIDPNPKDPGIEIGSVDDLGTNALDPDVRVIIRRFNTKQSSLWNRDRIYKGESAENINKCVKFLQTVKLGPSQSDGNSATSRDKHSQVNLIVEKLELITKLTAVKTGRSSKTPRPKRHTRSKHNQFSVGNQKTLNDS